MSPEVESRPDVKELTIYTDHLLEVSTNYKVANAAEYEVAGLELQRVKGAQKRLEDIRKNITRPMDEAKKRIMDFFRGPEDKLMRAESGIKRAMNAFNAEQDRKRRDEQARADELARKEQERLRAQAAKAAASGKVEKAEALQERASSVVAPIIRHEAPKVVGVNTRKVWKFEVTDPMAVPRAYCSVDEKKIRPVVGALKGDTNIPGIRVWSEDQIAAGSTG